MSKLYGGFDAGSTQCYVNIIDGEGECVVDTDIPTGEETIIALFDSLDPLTKNVTIHIEASELTEWVRRIMLRKTQIPEVVASDPKKLSLIASSPCKSDPEDAWRLARTLRMGETFPVHYSDDEKMVTLKKLVQHRENMVEEKTRIKNRIKAFLRRSGTIIKDSSAYSQRRRPEILKGLEDPIRRECLEGLYEMLDKLKQITCRSKKRLKKLSKHWPIIEYFQEVPGVGIILASRFVAYIQTPYRFDSKQALWTYCKMGLTHRSSNGEILSSPHLNPNGVGALKDLSRSVFENAMRTKEENGISRSYYESVERTHDSTHARLNTQRKVLTILWSMWRKEERYDDSRA